VIPVILPPASSSPDYLKMKIYYPYDFY